MRSMKTALAIIAVAGLSACASTTTSNSGVDGYVKSPDGKVVKDPFDLCWRTGFWSAANANQECDSDLAPKAAAPAPAPVVAAPARPAAPPAVVAPVVPAPVAPRAVTPPPPPAPVAAAPAAPKMCSFTASFENDELFAFNKSILTSSAKSRLDGDVMTKIANCKELKLVLVNGHTDRLGSAGYNQKLSEKRAAIVQAYLTSKGVKDVETLGNGKTLPIKSCDDKAPRKTQIECLAPNRRVVIEVTGTAK
jgi:OmpA-OmpF porin, OOP family